MKVLLGPAVLVLTALALAVAGAAPARTHDRSTAVTRWIDVDLAEIAGHRTNPPRAAMGLALLSVAIDDATGAPRKHRRTAVAGAATTAQLLAALNTAQADAFIACWDAKYTYWSERPVTAIRR
jgi:hypothetical protein